MSFVYGYFWWTLLLLPVAAWLLWPAWGRSRLLVARFFEGEKLRLFLPELKYGLQIAAFGLMLAALIGPYILSDSEEASAQRRAIYFLLDLSASMNAADAPPSRLARSKDLIKRLAKHYKGDQVGLIAFTDYPYVQCPLTTDHKAFELFLDMVETRQFGNKGTNFRKALLMAHQRFEQQDSATAARSLRAIVLLSDGENFSEPFHSVVNKLRKEHITLVPIGVGTAAGAPIPVEPLGKDYILDEKGQPVRSVLNTAVLEQLAEDMGSRFLTLDGDVTSAVTAEIGRLSFSPGQLLETRQNHNLYRWLLFPAVLCLLASLFLMPVRVAR